MAEPFIAEIRMVGFNFAPRGWAFCDGQILPINQNQTLYSLLGTTYGGDGRTSFALPDMRGRTATGFDGATRQGVKAGEESVTLTGDQIPAHTHAAVGSVGEASSGDPTNNVAATPEEPIYADYAAGSSAVAMGANMLTNSGGGQAHDNMQPYQTVAFCIALQGLFPSRN